MTATPPAIVDQAQYDGLQQILPKLARPSWVWQIGTPLKASETLLALQAESLDKKAKKKEAKRKYSAYKKLLSAIHGTA